MEVEELIEWARLTEDEIAQIYHNGELKGVEGYTQWN